MFFVALVGGIGDVCTFICGKGVELGKYSSCVVGGVELHFHNYIVFCSSMGHIERDWIVMHRTVRRFDLSEILASSGGVADDCWVLGPTFGRVHMGLKCVSSEVWS